MAGPQGDLLVVLAGAMHDQDPRGPILGSSSYLRTIYALRAWRAGEIRRILLVGEPSRAMERFLLASGVPAQVIQVETQSRSTRENAERARQLLAAEAGPVVLMTSDYHMFRARRVFANRGLRVRPRPIPDLLKLSHQPLWRWQGFLVLAEELAKIAYYGVRGWL